MDVDSTVLAIIREMAKIPTALKAWRPPVVDLLNDNRLFNCGREAAEMWRPVVKTLFDADKTAFPELLCALTPIAISNLSSDYTSCSKSDNSRISKYLYEPRVRDAA